MNTTDGKLIASNIRAERNRVKLTQEEVAKYLGISKKTYITYEDDAKNICATTLLELSRLFNCKISAFYMEKQSTECE